MPTSSGWLLLLACALVPGLAVLAGRRSALIAVLGASSVHLGLAFARSAPSLETWGTLACFWAAAGAILAGHLHMVRRVHGLAALCNVDEATGCLNRRGFGSQLERAARQGMRSGTPIALLALDLDHFKLVNDRFGHLSGDAVLREVSASLRYVVGDRGVVARLGGEEFAVLLPDADAEHAGVMAERILAALRGQRLEALPLGANLTMSAGIAVERLADLQGTDALRARADEALYAAKRSGRDRALLWAPGVHCHATPIRALPAVR